MVAFFVLLKALCRLLEPRELPSREHAAELLGKSDDGWVRARQTDLYRKRSPVRQAGDSLGGYRKA